MIGLGAAAAAMWAMTAVVAGNLILDKATQFNLVAVLAQWAVIVAFFLPIIIVKCVILRHYGRAMLAPDDKPIAGIANGPPQ